MGLVLVSTIKGQINIAADCYNAVLESNLLAETHAWHYNAAHRLASLLVDIGDPEPCEKALKLWEGVLRSGDRLFPSETWPERRPILSSALLAAAKVENTTLHAEYTKQMEHLERVLGLKEQP